MKEIANWINYPSAAIWMATLALHILMTQNKMPAKFFLLEKYLVFTSMENEFL